MIIKYISAVGLDDECKRFSIKFNDFDGEIL